MYRHIREAYYANSRINGGIQYYISIFQCKIPLHRDISRAFAISSV